MPTNEEIIAYVSDKPLWPGGLDWLLDRPKPAKWIAGEQLKAGDMVHIVNGKVYRTATHPLLKPPYVK